MKNKIKKLFLPVIAFCLLFQQSALANFTFSTGAQDQATLSYTLNPGQSVQGTAVVQNTSTQPVGLTFYAADATLTRQGSFAATFPYQTQRTIGKWVTFDQPSYTLQPNETKTLNFTAAVPNQTAPGSYAGALAAVTSPPASKGGSASVGVASRIIIPFYITVPGKINQSFDVTDFTRTVNAQGDNIFDLKVANNGNTVVAFQAQVQVTDQTPFFSSSSQNTGANSGSQQVAGIIQEQSATPDVTTLNDTILTQNLTIFQGQTLDLPLTWKNKPLFGTFTARATVTYWEVDLTTGNRVNPQVIQKDVTFTIFPWWLLWIILAVLALIVIFIVAKKLRTYLQKKNSQPYIVGPGETLYSIATKTGASWKLIAHMNKIAPPYEIKPGSTILVPNKNINKK